MGELVYLSDRRPAAPERIECLACGAQRVASNNHFGLVGECSICGYLGWAAPPQLSELDRKGLHRQLKVRTRATAPESTAVSR
jgi:hypothetical protein